VFALISLRHGWALADEADAGGEHAASSAPAGLAWFGYADFAYLHPTGSNTLALWDTPRVAFGAQWQPSARTRLLAEVEIEHAISSASITGEAALEQAYIEHDLGPTLQARLGIFLVPSGVHNLDDEPDEFYGVLRNQVETVIIPTSWPVAGLALQRRTADGWHWSAGLTTGFDMNKWTDSADEAAESPLGGMKQEHALARGAHLSGFLAANRELPRGLRLGGSLFIGDAAQATPGLPDSRVSLLEGHARWQFGRWELAALYARGHISDTAPMNLRLAPGFPLVPEDFYGWYVEAAWRPGSGRGAWPTPFVRYERYNTAAGYASLQPGLTPAALPAQRAFTVGLQLDVAHGLTLKADYIGFGRDGRDGDGSRIELGVGYEL
jgi:hypothetical protein